VKIYVLAQNKKEADDLYTSGYGYTSRKAAETARSSPEIDSYYRNLIKIYEYEPCGADEHQARDMRHKNYGNYIVNSLGAI
jgi:hypothetical protein